MLIGMVYSIHIATGVNDSEIGVCSIYAVLYLATRSFLHSHLSIVISEISIILDIVYDYIVIIIIIKKSEK